MIHTTENLTTGMHLPTLRDENKIYSCTGDAKVPHVSVVDISNVAFVALTQQEPPNRDYRIVGSELLTYDEVCSTCPTYSFPFLALMLFWINHWPLRSVPLLPYKGVRIRLPWEFKRCQGYH